MRCLLLLLLPLSLYWLLGTGIQITKCVMHSTSHDASSSQAMIKVTSLVLHHHIAEGCAMSWPIDPRFNIFNDPPGMEVGSSSSSKGGGGVANGSGFQEVVVGVAGGGGEGGWGPRGAPERPSPSYAEVR